MAILKSYNTISSVLKETSCTIAAKNTLRIEIQDTLQRIISFKVVKLLARVCPSVNAIGASSTIIHRNLHMIVSLIVARRRRKVTMRALPEAWRDVLNQAYHMVIPSPDFQNSNKCRYRMCVPALPLKYAWRVFAKICSKKYIIRIKFVGSKTQAYVLFFI